MATPPSSPSASSPHGGSSGSKHPSKATFLSGDGIRGVAAVAVLVFHAAFGAAIQDGHGPRIIGDIGTDFGGAFGSGDRVFAAMALAVYVFFALSGYLLSRHYVAAYVAGREMPSARRFLRNRVLRIVPAFWVALVLTWLVFGIGDATPLELVGIAAMAQVYFESPAEGAIAHAWTIDTEWALYLGIPLVAWGLWRWAPAPDRPGRRLAVLAATVATAYLISLGFRAGGPAETDYQRLFWAAGWSFLPGVALALVEVRWAERLRGVSWGRPAARALVLAWVISLALFTAVDPERAGVRAVLATVVTLLTLAAPLVAQWTDGRGFLWLDSRPLRWLGERTYSFYLVHFVVSLKLDGWLSDDGVRDLPWLIPLMLAGTTIAAAVLYRLVEEPFLRRKAPQAAPA